MDVTLDTAVNGVNEICVALFHQHTRKVSRHGMQAAKEDDVPKFKWDSHHLPSTQPPV